MRSGYVPTGELLHVLAALTPQNRLICELSLFTGLRVSDVLNLRSENFKQRMVVKELKTGKKKSVKLPVQLFDRCLSSAGKIFVFEGRNDYRKHRTRQAVYNDIRRAAMLFRIKDVHLSVHSCRKNYAVDEFNKDHNLPRVQKLLNHDDVSVTMLYALADVLEKRKK